MERIRRRTFVSGLGAAISGVFAVDAVGARQDAHAPPARTLEPELFGTATRTGALQGATFIGDIAYVITRYGNPTPILAEFDLVNGELLHQVTLPAGTGGYTMVPGDGVVYFGLTVDPHVWEYDVTTKAIRQIAAVGPDSNWTYGLAIAPDGIVYAGTYPEGEVWRVDPATGEAASLGSVSSSDYARVAADDRFVYGGSQPPGKLLAFPREGGDTIDLTSALPDPDAGVAALVATGGLVHVACGTSIVSVSPDGSTSPVVRALPNADRIADAMTVTADGDILAVGRPSCTIYRLDGDQLVDLGAVLEKNETRGVHVRDSGAIVGVAGGGIIWTLNEDGSSSTIDVVDAGVSFPEKAQAIAMDGGGRIWVGGHFSATVHEPRRGLKRRFPVNGEPKALVSAGRRGMYAALYPSTDVVRMTADLEVETLGTIGKNQYRPREGAIDTRSSQLLIASGPDAGLLDGALTFVDLDSGEFDVREGILPHQSVMSVALDDGIAYICGDTYGEQSPPRERETAQVAAVDLDSREVLWAIEPMAQWGSLEHVAVHDGWLYCVARRPRGSWFAMDLDTHEIVLEGQVSGYGEISAHNGRVYASTNFSDQLALLPGRDGGDLEILYEPIPLGWYNNPMLVFDRTADATWGMWGTELARLPLR